MIIFKLLQNLFEMHRAQSQFKKKAVIFIFRRAVYVTLLHLLVFMVIKCRLIYDHLNVENEPISIQYRVKIILQLFLI